MSSLVNFFVNLQLDVVSKKCQVFGRIAFSPKTGNIHLFFLYMLLLLCCCGLGELKHINRHQADWKTETACEPFPC